MATQQSYDNLVDQKNEIELSLARTILTQLEKKTISFSQAQTMARFIVERIDDATTEDTLIRFLQTLAKQWEIFSTTYEFYKIHSNDEKHLNRYAYAK